MVPVVKNILVTGLSCTGILLFNRSLTEALIDRGYAVTTKDCLGTAHRGTLVITEIRYADGDLTFPNFIPYGEADLLVGFEPLETLRLGALYAKRGGVVIMNTTRVTPSFQSIGRDIFSDQPRPLGYPSNEWIVRHLSDLGASVYSLDATREAEAVGHYLGMNMVMLGATLASAQTPVTMAEVERKVRDRSPKGTAETNLRALEAGVAAFHRSAA